MTTRFTLYVAGHSVRSRTAIENLERFGSETLKGDYEMVVVDVLVTPAAAEEARILATPTLVRESPPPPLRVVGDLSDAQSMMTNLEL
ncbi:MAG: circadian clock KaiB family protein [Planctomycetia bacterium]